MTTKKNTADKNPDSGEIDFSGDAGAGFENVGQDDLGTPFIIILQALSPELRAESSKYKEGLKEGMIVNSITGEAYGGPGEPMVFVPCGYQKAYPEWKPRDLGGGFIQQHVDLTILEGCTKDDRGRDMLENGNQIVTTAYVFGFIVRDGEKIACVISFTSTQLKKARQWLSTMTSIKMNGPDGQKFTAPMFSHKYSISTVPESNAKGNWFGYKIENAGLVQDSELVLEAKETHRRVLAGQSGINLLAARNEEQSDTDAPF